MAGGPGQGHRSHGNHAKKITFNRKQFAPYLDGLDSDKELEALFLEFLRERAERR